MVTTALGSGGMMNFVLLRFALIAGGVLILLIIGFAVLMMLKRRGTVSQETINRAREHAVPLARSVMENRRRGGRGRGGLLGTVASALNDSRDRDRDRDRDRRR
ncbi:hypothetical protein [Streptomyces sp. NPDC007100]|uniref:hypothetical protein n=1 Tax=Streptomyces sp. NPDC007100 TaxID=3155602 RepID=UPI0033E001D3